MNDEQAMIEAPSVSQELDEAVMHGMHYDLSMLKLCEQADLLFYPSMLAKVAKTQLEHEPMSDPGECLIHPVGLSEGPPDKAKFALHALPLPVTYADSNACYTNAVEHAGRRLSDQLNEASRKLLLERAICVKRYTSDRNACDLVAAMVFSLVKAYWYGPYALLHNLVGFGGVRDERVKHTYRWEALSRGSMLLVQCTTDAFRLVAAMKPKFIRWKEQYRAVCVIVPQVRANYYKKHGAAYGEYGT
jgi:hypothetical protein